MEHPIGAGGGCGQDGIEPRNAGRARAGVTRVGERSPGIEPRNAVRDLTGGPFAPAAGEKGPPHSTSSKAIARVRMGRAARRTSVSTAAASTPGARPPRRSSSAGGGADPPRRRRRRNARTSPFAWACSRCFPRGPARWSARHRPFAWACSRCLSAWRSSSGSRSPSAPPSSHSARPDGRQQRPHTGRGTAPRGTFARA